MHRNDTATYNLENLFKQPGAKTSDMMSLVVQGADPNVTNENGVYLLDFFMQNHFTHPAAQQLIEKYRANISLAFKLNAHEIDLSQVTINEILGSGTYAAVFKATYNNKEIAWKQMTFKAKIASNKTYKDCLNSYLDEIKIMSTVNQINSDNLIKLTGYIIQAPYYVIGMEFAVLGSLEKLIEVQPKLLKPHVLQIAKGIAAGVSKLHQHFILHNDIKPANIVVTASFVPKMIDFGLSCLLSDSQSAGTPTNEAPEIIDNKFNNTKSDVFSLGTTLHETIHRKIISFPSNVKNADDVFDYLESGKRVFTSTSKCSFQIAMLINWCWQFSPDLRPSAREVQLYLAYDEMSLFHKLKNHIPHMLSLVCKYNREDLAIDLIKNYSDVNEMYQEGCTPLHFACENANLILIKLLITHGAKLTVKDSANKTVLDAAFNSHPRNDDLIFILLSTVSTMTLTIEPIMSELTLDLAVNWANSSSHATLFDKNFFDHIRSSLYISTFIHFLNESIVFNTSSRLYNVSNATEVPIMLLLRTRLLQPELSILDKNILIYAVLCQQTKAVMLTPARVSRIADKMGFKDLLHASLFFKNYILMNLKAGNRQGGQLISYMQTDKIPILCNKSHDNLASELISQAQNENDLYQAAEQIGYFKYPSSTWHPASDVNKIISNFFKGTNSASAIPLIFGLRKKAETIKQTAAMTTQPIPIRP